MKYPDRFIAVQPAELDWIQSRSQSGPKGIQYKTITDGSEPGSGLPDIHLCRYDPNWTEPRHRHLEDEVLVLTAGSIEVDQQTYQAPTVIYIGRHTLYGPLTAGPEGVEFYRIGFSEKQIQLSGEPATE